MNNKTYTILQSFDKYEVNRLRKFLQSPYFNMNEAIVALFEIFIKDIFSKSTKELTKEKIWEKIYDKKKYDDVRFRKLNSELLKLVEKFLAQQVYEENPVRQAVHLMESVGEKKLEKLYNSTLRRARMLSEKQEFRPANFYFYQYEIEKKFYGLTDFFTKRGQKSNIEEIAQNLDIFYLSEKLRLYASILARVFESSYEYKFFLIDNILDFVKTGKFNETPSVAIYYQICMSYRYPEKDNHYFSLRKLLNQFSSEFPNAEAYDMYIYASNYCIIKSNQGNLKFRREYFELNKELIEKGLIFVNGELPPWSFKNIVQIALRLGEYDWTKSFIEDFKLKLPENFRENAVTFNLAQLYFYQKNYDEVIKLLNQVEYEDLAYNLNSKLMLIAVYYETDEIEPLYSLFESFRVYLNRNKKIPQDRKRRYLNLIKFTKKLTKLMPSNKKAIEKLNTEIAETEGGIINLKWLKEKITELS